MAIVYATKQFCHYLLGRPFIVVTNHAPLPWLSAQKMEGLLCWWALALQEYNFQIQYINGSSNSNADALSRCPPQRTSDMVSAVITEADITALCMAQELDPCSSGILQTQKCRRLTSGLLGTLRIWPPLRKIEMITILLEDE